MKKFDIVILQYNNLEDTVQYIDNLRLMNWDNLDYHFIVVDNASPNGCGQELIRLYGGDDHVHVILSEENLGFARGNNLGIVYASEQFGSDFIAVSNNDIKIEDPNFFQKLVSIHAQDTFTVCGPDIFSVSKQHHQSPIRTQLQTEQDLHAELADIDRKLRQLWLLKKLHLYEFLRKLRRLLRRGSGGIAAMQPDQVQHDVVIHGAFFVLTQSYLARYPRGLYDGTFLYKEEDILAYLCTSAGLKIRYCPELKLLHYDGMATRKATNSRVDKYIFELEHTRKSAITFLELMRQHSSEGD